MDATKRKAIVRIVSQRLDEKYEQILCRFLKDELFYSELNIISEGGGEEEVNKILKAYGLMEEEVPKDIVPLMRIMRKWHPKGCWDHVDLNDYVSYIGCYYDGMPTSVYRKKGRFVINPIIIL